MHLGPGPQAQTYFTPSGNGVNVNYVGIPAAPGSPAGFYAPVPVQQVVQGSPANVVIGGMGYAAASPFPPATVLQSLPPFIANTLPPRPHYMGAGAGAGVPGDPSLPLQQQQYGISQQYSQRVNPSGGMKKKTHLDHKCEWKLFIGQLDFSMNEDDVADVFSQAGEIDSVKILRTNDGRSKGCGFICYSNRFMADTAISQFQGRVLPGGNRPLTVKFAS
jgi:hypothetical protein